MNVGTFPGIPNVGASASQRRQTFTLMVSNAALAIPSWAQGGKGWVLVSGVGGGGGSGGSGGGANIRSWQGAAGAHALAHRVAIPVNVTSVEAAIGVAGVAGIAGAAGGAGGTTELRIEARSHIALGGGTGGPASSTDNTSNGGIPALFGENFEPTLDTGIGTAATERAVQRAVMRAFGTMSAPLFRGLNGYRGTASNITTAGHHLDSGYTPTPFGGGVTAAAGYGFGFGGRQNNVGDGSAAGFAGGPGLLILEFVEGF